MSNTGDDDPLRLAVETARKLKPGTWESVEALAFLAAASTPGPEAQALYRSALDASRDLKPGTWVSVRALAVLAWAGQLLQVQQ